MTIIFCTTIVYGLTIELPTPWFHGIMRVPYQSDLVIVRGFDRWMLEMYCFFFSTLARKCYVSFTILYTVHSLNNYYSDKKKVCIETLFICGFMGFIHTKWIRFIFKYITSEDDSSVRSFISLHWSVLLCTTFYPRYQLIRTIIKFGAFFFSLFHKSTAISYVTMG